MAVAFAVSAVASAGLWVTYWRGGQPQVEGVLIALALGGLAVGLVLWAKDFLPAGGLVEEREPLASTPAERRAFQRDFERGEEYLERRSFLIKMLTVALGALGIAAVFPIRSLGPKPGRSLFRTAWRTGSRVVTEDGRALTAADLPVGGVLTVFPEGRLDADSQTLLIRMDPDEFVPQPGRESWSPAGYVAYSKICTHAGCPVGLYEQGTGRLFCPCHQSVFEARDGAKPTAGPATRPLPQLPLSVDRQGYLRARGDFPEPVGPGFWNRP
ncbi:MAG TPA: Rieske 2Fe-2S domain-containing protein [Actinomycetota bacterium]